MWDRDEEPVVIYHSHTATEAYPSRTDIGLASEPGDRVRTTVDEQVAGAAGDVQHVGVLGSGGQVRFQREARAQVAARSSSREPSL